MKKIYTIVTTVLILTTFILSSNCDEKIDDLYVYFARAITSGDVGRMENAIKHGADVNHYFKDGTTPLIHAIQRNQLKSIKYLIKEGADVNKPEKKERYYRPLHKAIDKQNSKIIKYLVEHGADVNGKSWHGTTAFSWSTSGKNINIVKYLHNKGGKISQTHLHFVYDLKIAQYLLKNGTKIDDYYDIGATALHTAIIDNNIQYARFLINHGADVNKKTIKGGYTGLEIGKSYGPGTTPLSLAKLCKRKKIIALLKEHGAQ